MRLDKSLSALILVLLLCVAAGSAGAATTLLGTSSNCGSLGANQVCTLTAGGANATLTWTVSPSVGTLAQPTTTGSGTQTNTYTAPPTVSSKTNVTVTATDGTTTWAATITLVGLTITITPTSASIITSQTQQFSATVTGATATGVNWSFTPQIGTLTVIDANDASYTAPSVVSGTTKVTVTATSQADASQSASATVTITQSIDIGSGAPTGGITQEFVTAFYRNGFNNLVGLPPLGRMTALGTTAGFYVQEFPDAAKDAGVKYALATASASASPNSDGTVNNVVQIYAPVYAYYTTIGAATAGYPLSDTSICPPFDPANSCQFQLFDKSYVLFVYSSPLGTTGATNFSVSSGIYTEWVALGGIGNIGRPIAATASVTATKTGSSATGQTFSAGVIYSITTGSAKGQVHGVSEPLYDLYVANGGPTGPLGLPTSEVIVNTVTGLRKQSFEGGILQYTPGGSGGVQYPVTGINLTGGAAAGATVNLNLGQTVTLTAIPVDAFGDQLTSLPISWSSTNSQVIAIQPQANSQSAVLTAVGGGSAKVTAASGGFTSGAILFVVIAPCCQVGDGAPPTVQQAFESALTRNKITVQIPVQSPASRSGAGYIQMVQSAGASPVSYLLAESDQSGSAYVVFGALLAQYQSLGGPSGTLGYPTSDAGAGGTQLFQNGALAGSPVQLVAGGILTKWALLGYETGAAGAPTGAASAFSTFGANSGTFQNFANGSIYSATAGPKAGSTFFVSGAILSAYNSDGGPGGELGMPVGEAFASAGVTQQNFEGGSITLASGASSAQVHAAARTPAVVVAPSSISAGAQALLAVSGFANGALITVSVTGQPNFVVTAANGAYSWNMFVPLNAASGAVTVSAKDYSGTSASGTLTIRGFDRNRVQMTTVGGSNQTGAPGSLLPLPLQVAMIDSSGAAVVGAPVTFTASAGQVSVVNAVTDPNGIASTYLRLPNTAGSAGVTAASSLSQAPVTLYAIAAASSIANFPSVQEAGSAALGNGTPTIGQKGALLSAVAGILRYQQNRNAVPSPNGPADAPTLNQFLTTYCGVAANARKVCDGFLSNSASGEQLVNLWRAAQFTGGFDVTGLGSAISAIADVVSAGEPVLLSLQLSRNGSIAGGHFIVATGIAADGSIVVQDPSPLFARTNLNDYVNGFTAAGGNWTGTLLSAVRFAVRSPSATRFLLGALSQPAALMNSLAFDVSSASGECGVPIQMLDTVDSAGNAPAQGPLVSRMQVCDGLLPAYQVSIGTSQAYEAFLTDLASGGSSFDLSGNLPVVDQASRPLLNLVLAPQVANFTAAAVVNGATFTGGIAPGGIISIFGAGLASPAGTTSVDVDGEAVTLLSASTFQINAVIPTDVVPGQHSLRVKSPYGTAQQTIVVSAVAPQIFLVGNPPAGAVENVDGSLNGPTNPAGRGQALVIYATGLGATTRQGTLSIANIPVTALVNGVEIPAQFAGLAPGYVGLYQINVPIALGTVPGLGISLTLKEGGQLSNSVSVAIQ